MTLDYHNLRVAWATATGSDAWPAPEQRERYMAATVAARRSVVEAAAQVLDALVDEE